MNRIEAVIYARFSSHNQTEASIDAQVRACRKYAEENDFEIIKIYADEAKSGTEFNRPAFQRMLNDSESGAFSVVLIHKTDRFSRNSFHSQQAKIILEKNGVEVVSVTEHFTDDPAGFFLEKIMEGSSQFYSMNLALEVKKGQYEAALKKKFLGGRPPLGYKVEDQKYVIDDYNAKAIDLIFNMYCAGFSYKKIAEELNKQGYKTQRNKKFTKNAIRSILMNERYTGVYIYNQRKSKSKYSGKRNNNSKRDVSEMVRIEGGIPQIISKEKFQKAQKIMQQNENRKGGRRHRYLLSKKVKCGCGGIMCGNTRRSGRSKIQHSYYRCNKCGSEINVKYLNAFAIQIIKKNIKYSFDNSLSRITTEFNCYVENNKESLHSDLHSLKMKIDGNNKKIENLVNKLSAMEGNTMESEIIVRKVTELEKMVEYLEAEKTTLEEKLNVTYSKSKVRQAFADIMPYIEKNDTIAVRNFIIDNIEEITVDKENNIVMVTTK